MNKLHEKKDGRVQKIFALNSDRTTIFAWEELKKYLEPMFDTIYASNFLMQWKRFPAKGKKSA